MSLPSKYAIFNYWKDKIIVNNKVYTQSKSLLDAGGWFIRDWMEPVCWGCGKSFISKYEKTGALNSVSEKAIWNNVQLQRCHIIPRSLKGSDECSNLFLMCEECHDKAPDTSDPSVFYTWLSARSSEVAQELISKIVEFEKELIKWGIFTEVEKLFLYFLTFYEFSSELLRKYFEDSWWDVFENAWNNTEKVQRGDHWYQSPHNRGCKVSSLVGEIMPPYLRLKEQGLCRFSSKWINY